MVRSRTVDYPLASVEAFEENVGYCVKMPPKGFCRTMTIQKLYHARATVSVIIGPALSAF